MKTNTLFETVRDSRIGVILLCTLAAVSTSVEAQTNLLKVDYQWADSLTGPWTRPPGSQTYVQPDGSLLTLTTEPLKHFRLTIQEIDFEDIETPAVQVVDLRRDTLDIAWSHLHWLLASQLDESGSQGSWSNASLAPIAFKVFDLAYQNGKEPAYIEFKIVSDFQPAGKPAEFLEDNEVEPARDLGHILVSLHEGDAPVPEFSESGLTPCEQLLRRVGNLSNYRIMRFGPTFATVENERGELLANAGADPFKVPHEFLEHRDQTFMGEFDSETAQKPPVDGYGGPRMAVQSYKSYGEFKEDYLNNPVYQLMRERKAQSVAREWALLRGESVPEPQIINATVRQRVHVLKGQTISRFFLDDDEGEGAPLAAINIDGADGGLLITGGREGSAPLTIETAEGAHHFDLVVSPGGATGGGMVSLQSFTPGWQTPSIWSVAGGYSSTPRYHQTKDYNLWCSKVGCGPVAWAILCGHWDRERNVPAAFYRHIPGDFTISDAPFKVSDKPSHMHAVYAALHDYCDVICDPFSSAGATPPGDMIEGGATYLWLPKVFGYLGYSYSWAWDLNDPDWNEPSNRIRSSVKNGRPAIVGLGWLWHYGVAYKYRYQEFKVTPNIVLLRRRWFACNEGWGKNKGAWYSGYDTFLGASIKPWQKTP